MQENCEELPLRSQGRRCEAARVDLRCVLAMRFLSLFFSLTLFLLAMPGGSEVFENLAHYIAQGHAAHSADHGSAGHGSTDHHGADHHGGHEHASSPGESSEHGHGAASDHDSDSQETHAHSSELEHGCGGIVHTCPCHASVSFLAPDLPPQLVQAVLVSVEARPGVERAGPIGHGDHLFRPPLTVSAV